jgi:hypothetical protein
MRTIAGLALALGLLATTTGAAAVNVPGRSYVRPAPVSELALTHASIAFVVGATAGDCDHVELWNTNSRGTWRFGRPRPCGDVPSTGAGISDVAVATSRVLWLEYAGGNIRDWQLQTATVTRKSPRRLRFVSRDVDAPPPIVLGDGARDGIPYAVDDEVTFVGNNGARIFRVTVPAKVTALAAGPLPGPARIAVLVESGPVVLLTGAGREVTTLDFPPGAVRAIRLAGVGLVAQVGREVRIGNVAAPARTVTLPPAAVMLDYAQGRVLYRLGRSVYTARVATGARAMLLLPFATTDTPVELDVHGLAWARRRSLNWKCAVCIRFGT